MQARRVVVRVGDDDGADAAELLDPVHGLVVDVSEAVPEDVAARGAAEEGALSNGEFWDGVDADEEEVVFDLVDDELVAVLLGLLQRTEGGPGLAGREVLAAVIEEYGFKIKSKNRRREERIISQTENIYIIYKKS